MGKFFIIYSKQVLEIKCRPSKSLVHPFPTKLFQNKLRSFSILSRTAHFVPVRPLTSSVLQSEKNSDRSRSVPSSEIIFFPQLNRVKMVHYTKLLTHQVSG